MRKKIIMILIILFIIFFILWYCFDKQRNDFEEIDIQIEKTDENFIQVKSAKELEAALVNNNIKIIEINNDIDLGYNVIKKEIEHKGVFENHNEPIIHPKLMETGVSKLKINKKDGLILYSNNGAKILHCNIKIENSKNIKIDNISFEELWEWDEETKAEYDRNNWDYISINNCDNICISHCEFSKAYDGITDITNSNNITIKFCKLNEINTNDEFYNQQFEYLENNIDNYSMYNFLRKKIQLSYDEIKELSSYQFKVYTIGLDNEESCDNIVIHDCMYLNAKTRIPMIRNGRALVYNIYADSTNLTKVMDKLLAVNKFEKIKKEYSKVVSLNSYGIIATENSYVLAKNTIFKGAKYPYVTHKKGKDEQAGNIKIQNDTKLLQNLKNDLEKTVGIINYQK